MHLMCLKEMDGLVVGIDSLANLQLALSCHGAVEQDSSLWPLRDLLFIVPATRVYSTNTPVSGRVV